MADDLSKEELLRLYDNADPSLLMSLRDIQTALGLSDEYLLADLAAGLLKASMKEDDVQAHGDPEKAHANMLAMPMSRRLDLAWVNAADLQAWIRLKAPFPRRKLHG